MEQPSCSKTYSSTSGVKEITLPEKKCLKKKMLQIVGKKEETKWTRKNKIKISSLLRSAENNQKVLSEFLISENAKELEKGRKFGFPGVSSERAARICPPFLFMCRSGIREDGLGVWTEISLPEGVIFGPYCGKVVKESKGLELGGYAWGVHERGREKTYVDASTLSDSSWLRFVNCAESEEHQNLVAFQYDRGIYYKTCKAVRPFTELLVWYGDLYADELSIGFNDEEEQRRNDGNGNGTNKCLLESASRGEFSRQRNSPSDSEEEKGSKSSASISGLRHLQENAFLCIVCGKTFRDRWSLRIHRRTHAESRGSNFAENLQQKHSETSHKNATGRTRSQSVESSSGSSDVGIRVKAVHERLKPHKCPHCKYSALRPSILKCHVDSVHLGQKPQECPHCEYRCAVSSNLKRHVSAVHDRLKPHMCPHCEYRASRSSTLKSHVDSIHMRQKPQACPQCEYRCAEPSNLRKHINAVHERLKDHKCPHCEYITAQSCHLKSHISTVHLRLKPHKCLYCEYKCSESGSLKKHVNAVHLGEKPHQCPHCEYRASQISSLKRHVTAMHMRLKDHSCRDCAYSHIDKRYICVHHLGQKSHKCAKCNFYARNFPALKRHVFEKHSNRRTLS